MDTRKPSHSAIISEAWELLTSEYESCKTKQENSGLAAHQRLAQCDSVYNAARSHWFENQLQLES
jgi:hypothetical protein